MASLVLSGDTSGSITVSAPAVAGSTTQTLVNVTGTLAPIVSGTAVTASGTSVDFTGIPSWVKRITVMFSGVSTNGTSPPQLQIGAGSFTTSGYLSANGNVQATPTSVAFTSGFGIGVSTSYWSAGIAVSGIIVLTNITGNTWVCSGSVGRTDGASIYFSTGNVAIGGTLDRVRITTANGTDTFDAGTINLLWE